MSIADLNYVSYSSLSCLLLRRTVYSHPSLRTFSGVSRRQSSAINTTVTSCICYTSNFVGLSLTFQRGLCLKAMSSRVVEAMTHQPNTTLLARRGSALHYEPIVHEPL